MGVSMADDKKTLDQPTFVINTPQVSESPRKSRLTKKHVVIAVVSLLIAVIVIVGVLVAIRIYTSNELEMMKLQYSMTMKDRNNNDVQQNVSVDANIVQYHILKDDVEAWIIHDFDKDLEVSKVKSESGTLCFVNALNRSNAQEPSKIPSTAPNPDDKTPSRQLVYKVSETPISDISFMGKRASSMCNNIPTYWMVPNCNGESTTHQNITSPVTQDRTKRATVCATCGGYYCVCGCCNAVCGSFASSTYTWRLINGVYYCTFYMYSRSCTLYLGPSCNLGGRNYYYPWS